MSTKKPAARDGFVRGTPQGNTLARRSLVVIVSLGLLALVVLGQLGENGIFAFAHLSSHAADLHREVTELAEHNSQMEQQLEDLAHDPEALEHVAREKYNMRRADEEVLVLVKPKPAN